MNGQIEISSSSSVSKASNEIEAFVVRFNNFENLPMRRVVEDYVKSPKFTCFEHEWTVVVYHGGYSNSYDGMVAIFSYHLSSESIIVKPTFTVKTSVPNSVNKLEIHWFEYKFQGGNPMGVFHGAGPANFIARSKAIDVLQKGKFVVEFVDENLADVVFKVKNQEAKAMPVVFHAHSLILEEGAPTLFNHASVADGTSPIQINDIMPDQLIYYVYGGELDKEFLEKKARDIINAADKLVVVHLKLEVEANLVSSTTFIVDNVMELLLYGCEKNCVLMKEAAMDFVAQNQKEFLTTVSFENARGHLTKDLLMAMNMGDSMRGLAT
ncbi:LOW QUALITY PROTEIN: hypothetical protein ACHAWF_002342 [Thalassiosira exigua]